MNRRYLIGTLGVPALGAAGFRPVLAASSQTARWWPDGAGFLARIGVLTPAFDPVPESELWAMAPPGVSLHASRVPWNREARSFAEPPHVDSAVEQLAGVAPRVILYAFTSSSYVLDAQEEDSLRARLETRAQGTPVVLTCPAGTAALRALGAHRIAIVHPPWFSAELNANGCRYYRAHGFEVVQCASITPARPFAEMPPAEIFDWTRANVPRKADAVFLAGNGLRAVGVIDALEERLRRPVLTANQVILWQALRQLGIPGTVKHYGRIFIVPAR